MKARIVLVVAVLTLFLTSAFGAQPLDSSGTLQGSVADATGAVVPGAKIQIHNRVTNYSASTTTDGSGQFIFHNVPFDHYHLSVSAPGFAPEDLDADVNSQVAVVLKLTLNVAASQTVVEVNASAELLESDPTAHTDVDSNLIDRLPQNTNSGLSSVIEQTAPGVVSDSNGLFHPLGEHADTSFIIDNQPISDQQSRTFSNQIATSTINSMEVISGVAPAEYGDKASLVVRTSTKSGLGSKGVHGGISGEYGSFGTASTSLNLSVGNDRWGNYTAIDGINSGRFLDTPEFRPTHAHGNSENLFNRSDYQFTPNDTLHLNLSLARSWFQQPNDYDQQAAGQDQRQQLRSFNFAPGYNHQFNATTLLSSNVWVRQDRVGYYPSSNRFADQPATLNQQRRLTSAGLKTDLSIVRGRHNFKAGLQWQHTFLSEFFQTGITDPTFNPICNDATGAAVSGVPTTDPSQCASLPRSGPNLGYVANASFLPGLLPFDLTRGGSLFTFRGRSDVKEESAYVQDSIKLKNLTLMGGVRGDVYNGISSDHAIQPRVGGSYFMPRTGTVLRASYGRLMLTPYNENLVLSSSTGSGGLSSNVFGAQGQKTLTTAHRNQFETGVQQGFGKYLVMDASYFWKYTNGDYDFDVLFNTPLSFPIQWKKSRIDGAAIRLTMPTLHGWSAYSAMGHTRSRFFGPETGGILFNSPVNASVFRIDHDQAFQQSTHVQYQFGKNLPWIGGTWNYESGMVAGNVPDYVTALGFTADQQAAIGLFCGSAFATLSSPIRSCASGEAQGATRVSIPAPGTENDDKNPPRIAPRHIFDVAIGDDNIFRSDKQKVSLRFSVSNLTDKVALYNFLSTFSGTHFLAPRTFSAQLGYSF
jgi:hypothetical protein